MSPSPASLLEPPTALRVLRADEGPYPGTLHGGEPRTVWVDLALVPEEVWRCATDGHVLAPLDIARTTAGHAAVFPYCRERLRARVHAGVSPGGAVTIAVSMLRGTVEAHAASIAGGAWWIDEAGRPVLAAGDGQNDAIEILTALADSAGPALAQALEGVAEALGRRRLGADDILPIEEELFAVAHPASVLAAPASAADADARTAPRAAASLRRDPEGPSAPDRWIDSVTDAEWIANGARAARAVAAAAAGIWTRIRTPRRVAPPAGAGTPQGRSGTAARHGRRRRAPWILAAGVAVVIVAGGMLWPDQDAARSAPAGVGGAEASTPDVSPHSETAAPSTATAPPVAGDDADSLVAAGTGVLAALAACAGEATCADVTEGGGPAPDGVVSAGASDVRISLLDSYGGVAVLRVEAPAQSPQVLVLVSANEKWLVRDVYDVADQP